MDRRVTHQRRHPAHPDRPIERESNERGRVDVHRRDSSTRHQGSRPTHSLVRVGYGERQVCDTDRRTQRRDAPTLSETTVTVGELRRGLCHPYPYPYPPVPSPKRDLDSGVHPEGGAVSVPPRSRDPRTVHSDPSLDGSQEHTHARTYTRTTHRRTHTTTVASYRHCAHPWQRRQHTADTSSDGNTTPTRAGVWTGRTRRRGMPMLGTDHRQRTQCLDKLEHDDGRK